MDQGVTQFLRSAENRGLSGKNAENDTINELAIETNTLREALHKSLIEDMTSDIKLGTHGYLPEAYEVGNIASFAYSLTDLPSNDMLTNK